VPTEITAYPDGPLLVRGEFELRDVDGSPIERRRKVIALCRCGRSADKPFCDGTHKLTGFRTEESTATPVEAPARRNDSNGSRANGSRAGTPA